MVTAVYGYLEALKQYQKQKYVQQIFSKIRNFRWIYDAHTLLNCLIIRLILKMDAALSAKTICNSPIYYPKAHAPGALLHRGRSEEDEIET